MKKLLIAILLLTLMFLNISAQEDFQWHNLVLNKTSAEEAIQTLGKPEKEKQEKIVAEKGNIWNVPPGESLTIRKVAFKNVDDYEKIELHFFNNKLIGFDFQPKKKSYLAAELPKKFNSEFLFVERFVKETNLESFEGQKETTVPKIYPGTYYMISVKPDVIIFARVDNNSLKAVMKDAMNKPTIAMFPGSVSQIQIIPRKLK